MSISTAVPELAPPLPFRGRRQVRLTVEKYEAMIASGAFSKRDRFELIEGSLVQKMTKYPPHVMATGLCHDAISQSLPSGWHARQEAPVRIAERDSEPEPDVSVARGARTDYLKRHPEPHEIALVVEVADSSVEDDREMAVTYGGASIPVYWLINIPNRQLEVYTEPSGPSPPIGYRRCTVLRPGDHVPLLIDGNVTAQIPVADLLPPLPPATSRPG
ncbi:MAG: Uma2 family endonuclease [Isosphaeraceae bacterium]